MEINGIKPTAKKGNIHIFSRIRPYNQSYCLIKQNMNKSKTCKDYSSWIVLKFCKVYQPLNHFSLHLALTQPYLGIKKKYNNLKNTKKYNIYVVQIQKQKNCHSKKNFFWRNYYYTFQSIYPSYSFYKTPCGTASPASGRLEYNSKLGCRLYTF